MTYEERLRYIDALQKKGMTKAKCFQYIGDRALYGELDGDDFLSMAELLGFPIHSEEMDYFSYLLSSSPCSLSSETETPSSSA